ncbi:hypothetical protein BGZ70_004011, partial [Mortierella alpina]
MSAAKLMMVVDPADARLYVTGTASSREFDSLVWGSPAYHSAKNELAVNDFAEFGTGSLSDYRGLYGKESDVKELAITYAP